MFQSLHHSICKVDNTVLVVVSETGERYSLLKWTEYFLKAFNQRPK